MVKNTNRLIISPVDGICPRGYILVPGFKKRDGTWVKSYCRRDVREERHEVERVFEDHLRSLGYDVDDNEGVTSLMKRVDKARKSHPVAITDRQQLEELLDGPIGWKKMTIYRNGKYEADEYSSSEPFRFFNFSKSKMYVYTEKDTPHIIIDVRDVK